VGIHADETEGRCDERVAIGQPQHRNRVCIVDGEEQHHRTRERGGKRLAQQQAGGEDQCHVPERRVQVRPERAASEQRVVHHHQRA
jgi:hypothetical protein